MDINLIPHPLQGTPYGSALDLTVVLAITCWLLSVITREYSWVDRIWTVCPPIYCLMVAADSDFGSARLNIMTLLVMAWGARLTFNLARKGGYWRGGEDHRWKALREQLGPIKFQILNLTFVAPGQLLVIWLFTSPVHQAWTGRDQPLNLLDAVAISLFAVLWVVEAINDQQMWAFQQDKKRRVQAGEPVTQPFVNSGLFRYCRHPSYVCEMGMWTVFYLFGVAATGQWIHWSGLGFIFLMFVIGGSTRLTESISLDRYPSYRGYRASTPRFIPFTRMGRIRHDN